MNPVPTTLTSPSFLSSAPCLLRLLRLVWPMAFAFVLGLNSCIMIVHAVGEFPSDEEAAPASEVEDAAPVEVEATRDAPAPTAAAEAATREGITAATAAWERSRR